MLVHKCSYASQPDVQIACTQAWGIPEWGQPKDLPADVHLLDTGDHYTFDDTVVTCPSCKKC